MIKKLFNKKEDPNKLFMAELLKIDFDVEILRDLIFNNNIDINFQNDSQKSFLHICLEKFKFKSANWLIHNNIDVTLKDKNNKTALDLAIEENNPQIVKELIKTDKFDINQKDKFARTLLQDVVVLGYNEIAQVLIEHGANINSKDLQNRNVIFDALSYGNDKFIDFLLSCENLELNNIDKNGDSIMHHPQVIQNDILAKKLIAHGANPTFKNKKGETYLCRTALRGMDAYHIIDEALKAGANINSRVFDTNNTILMELVSISSKLTLDEKTRKESLVEMSKKLLVGGMDINAIDSSGESALFRAVRLEDIELVSFLLNGGIDPNIQNNDLQSVLHLAVYQGIESLDIIFLLLRFKASPLVKNRYNQTIYEILNDIILHTHGKKVMSDQYVLSRIKKNGQYMVVLQELLSQNKEDLNFMDSTGNPLFFNPLLNDHFNLFKLYIKHGLNIHNTNVLNHNIFFEYILNVFEEDREDIDFQNNVSMLLSAKLDHNYQDETGWTIVHKILTTNCNIHLFDILTQVVLFDYEITDKLGRSVIHTAVWGDKKQAMKKIHLINRKIVNIPDDYGILPITYAALLGNQDLVLLFISFGANVKSGVNISKAAIKKFSPMLKNLENLTKGIQDKLILQKMNIVIDQVKRDFNSI